MSKNKSAAEAAPKIWELYVTSIMAGDPDQWMKNWTEDCVQMPPGAPVNVGSQMLYESISAWLNAYSVSDFKIFDDMEIQETGDWAYCRGQFSYKLTPKDSSPSYVYEGKFMSIFQRQADGEWKLHRDCFNSNTPDH